MKAIYCASNKMYSVYVDSDFRLNFIDAIRDNKYPEPDSDIMFVDMIYDKGIGGYEVQVVSQRVFGSWDKV